MSWLKRLFTSPKSAPRSFVQVDFEETFPHAFWTSAWSSESGVRRRYKVLSVRREPAGNFEVVVVQEESSGEKAELQRFAVPADKFDASAQLIDDLEATLGVRFDRVDMSGFRDMAAFEKECIRIGWETT